MATITKTSSKTWKAIIRKRGWPTTVKTFRTKRDAQDWARCTEDDMVRGVYIDRAPSENTTLKSALTRYLAEISPSKSPGSPRRETIRAKPLLDQLGDYAIVAITPDLVARYRDDRLALGKSNNTARTIPLTRLAVQVPQDSLAHPIRPLNNELGKVARFSLHAGVMARADERQKLERLCRYIKPPGSVGNACR